MQFLHTNLFTEMVPVLFLASAELQSSSVPLIAYSAKLSFLSRFSSCFCFFSNTLASFSNSSANETAVGTNDLPVFKSLSRTIVFSMVDSRTFSSFFENFFMQSRKLDRICSAGHPNSSDILSIVLFCSPIPSKIAFCEGFMSESRIFPSKKRRPMSQTRSRIKRYST